MTRVSVNGQKLDEYRRVAGKLEQGVRLAAEEVRLQQEKNNQMTARLFPFGAGRRLDGYADAAKAEADQFLKLAEQYQEISRKASGFLTRYLDILSAMDSSEAETSPVAGTGGMNWSGEIHDVSDLSPEQRRAVSLYTRNDYYENINNSLRGQDTLTPECREITEYMRSALKCAALPWDMVLYRGTSTNELGDLKDLPPEELVGKTYTQPGFMSTSKSEAIAETTFLHNMEVTIMAPKGAHALDITSISNYGINESEVLFDAGQEMLITSAKRKEGILYITVLLEER